MLPHAVAPPNKNKLLGFGCFKTPRHCTELDGLSATGDAENFL